MGFAWTILKKLLPSLLVVAVLLGLGYAVYRKGYNEGVQDVTLEWELDKAAQRAAHDALVAEYEKRETAHKAENARITHELAEVQKAHEVALAEQRSAYQHRLLLSSERAAVYQRQAEAGAAECRDLAGHAARLDRALEEGRHLVRELRGTLGLRDRQVIELGKQILNDRKLVAGENHGE